MNKTTKILYLDDDLINLELFRMLAKNEDIELLLANNSLEAFRMLSNNADIDLVFSDYQMPDMNGIEFIKKTKGKYGQIKCYLLTNLYLEPSIQRALDTKLLDGYIQKPLRKEKIMESILNAMGNGMLDDQECFNKP